MARELNRAEQAYPAGSYGPFGVDGLTRDDTNYLEVVMTVVSWPSTNPLFDLWMKWDNGNETRFRVPGTQLNKDGSQKTVVNFRFFVPRDRDGKIAVTTGSMRAQVFATFTTAITVRAV